MLRLLPILGLAALCVSIASAASAPTGQIVFSSASGVDGKTQVWMMNANGTGRHAISPPTSNDQGGASRTTESGSSSALTTRST